MKNMTLASLKKTSVKMHDDVADLENKMHDFIVIGKSIDHAVSVKMDAYHFIKEVVINPKWSGTNNDLANHIQHAFNDALEQVDNEIELRMSAIISRYTKEISN